MPHPDLSEREKYERMHREFAGYGWTNHGAGTEGLCLEMESLLDVGAGYSTYAADVLNRGLVKRAAATDISAEPMLEQEARGVEFYCVSALDMRLGRFDIVTAFDLLEHFPLAERGDSIANIYRHAKRRLIFSIGHLRSVVTLGQQKVKLHHTVQGREWWRDYLQPFGGRLSLQKLTSVIYTGERRETTYFVVNKEGR